MLVRRLTRPLWNSIRVERRYLASDPTKPEPESSDGIDPAQAEALDKDICLLVDEKDNFIGTATKRDCHKVAPDGSVLLHRAFSVFLFNKRGDMLLQRRASQKVTYPDYYTNACCSHPLYIDDKPEDVITAARRRLNYELGIPLDQMDPALFTYLTRIHYHDPGDGVWGEHEIDHVLFFQSDVKVKPNSNEISEYCFVPKNEFNAFLSSVDKLTPWFDIMQRHKIKQWWDNLHCLKNIADPNKIERLLKFIPTLEGPTTPWFNMVRRHRLKLWWDNLHRLKDLAEPDKIHKFLDDKK